jgi:hypothetical protein
MPDKRALKLNIKCEGVGASTRHSRLVDVYLLTCQSVGGWRIASDKGSHRPRHYSRPPFSLTARARPNKRLYFQPPLKLSFYMGSPL